MKMIQNDTLPERRSCWSTDRLRLCAGRKIELLPDNLVKNIYYLGKNIWLKNIKTLSFIPSAMNPCWLGQKPAQASRHLALEMFTVISY